MNFVDSFLARAGALVRAILDTVTDAFVIRKLPAVRPRHRRASMDLVGQPRARQADRPCSGSGQQLNETMEQLVAQRTRELQLANEELEAFSYSVSHDLRAPLAVVDGFCAAIIYRHGDVLPEEVRRYLDRIQVGTTQMNALIDNLLSFSSTVRAPLQLRELDLSVVAADVVDQLRHRFADRQVNVQIEPGLTASVDPTLISIVLTNLIGNAWKFSSRTPNAKIRMGRAPSVAEGEVVFHVSDNGAGFDMAFAGKLFKAFERLHSMSEFEGTGIGLAIVSRIVRRHGGTVWAESVPGQGAKFFFSLPTPQPRHLPRTGEPDNGG